MINFYPQKVPFLKAVKLLFTRRVWLAIQHNKFGTRTDVAVGFDKPKGALPLTQEVMEQQRQLVEEAQQKAAQEAVAAEVPQQDQAAQPQYSTRYKPPKKNRKQRRAESRGK